MIVVSDTSPISNLIQVKKLELLRSLYGTVFIPDAVYEELAYLDFQEERLRKEDWIVRRTVHPSFMPSGLLSQVDRGEAEAISLALELKAEWLLIDEQAGRSVAEQHGLNITGVLGILVKAKEQGLIPRIRPVMEQLRDVAAFRIHPRLFADILTRVGE